MRQYIAPNEFDSSGQLLVTGKDFRYMRQVLRISVGDMVQVRTPSGRLANTTVTQVVENLRQVKLQVCGDEGNLPLEGESQQDLEIWLFQCVARPQKMDDIIRQATECGVSKIVPVASTFSQAKASERNLRSERYERIIREARQQSGSPVATKVVETVKLDQAIELWQKEIQGEGASVALVLYERTEETQALHKALGSVDKVRRCALFCGSEGGISPEEIQILKEGGFIPVHFKTNILRCETAALYGIASLQCALTEKDLWQCSES